MLDIRLFSILPSQSFVKNYNDFFICNMGPHLTSPASTEVSHTPILVSLNWSFLCNYIMAELTEIEIEYLYNSILLILSYRLTFAQDGCCGCIQENRELILEVSDSARPVDNSQVITMGTWVILRLRQL